MQNDAGPGQLTRSENIEHLEFTPDGDEEEDPGLFGNLHSEVNEDRFFDSRDYRVCFNCIHVKICTFVLTTWILHGIILGALYLLSIFEESDSKSSILVILLCRAIQLATVGLLYYGLWKFKKRLLIPFIVSQFTIGVFADIQTLTMLIRQLEASGEYLPFTDEGYLWLNLVIPLVVYFAIVAFLIYVLYSAYIFINARSLHDKRRQQDKEQRAALNSHFGLDGSGAAPFLNVSRKDSIVPNIEGDLRSNSPALPQRTQNSIAMQSLSRTPSSQINAKATKFSAEQLRVREELIKRQSARNLTGSLQQLPSSFAGRTVNASTQPKISTQEGKPRLMSLSNVPYSRPTHEQSEPSLHLMLTKNH